MHSKFFLGILLALTGISCRKSNYRENVIPLIIRDDSLINWSVVGRIPEFSAVDLWFTTSSVGFAISKHIYETRDGGQSWSVIPNTPTLPDYYNLFFADQKTGFAQSRTQLVSTTDGGNSWRARPFPSNNAMTIFFTDAATGFYADENGLGLMKTTDSGNTWNLSINHTGGPYYPCFLNTDTGFAISSQGMFSSTTNGGKNWTLTLNSLFASSYSNAYNQLTFIDVKNGFYASPNGIFRTSDGGQTWQHSLSDTVDPSCFINVIRFADAKTGYYKANSVIYKTTDEGETWRIDCKLGSAAFIGMSVLDPQHVWACTSDGRILKIED